jgi:predicted metalloprotease with PDZ domain
MRSFSLLAFLLACGCAAAGGDAASNPRSRAAVLGLETGAPSPELAEELDLPFEVRQQCRVVTRAGEPAAGAGVRAGDVLFAIGDVDLYSQDDLDDVLRASRPGERVVLALARRGEPGVRKVEVVLGAGEARAPEGVAWRYASLASLPRALAESRAGGKNVLVGLSGAET